MNILKRYPIPNRYLGPAIFVIIFSTLRTEKYSCFPSTLLIESTREQSPFEILHTFEKKYLVSSRIVSTEERLVVTANEEDSDLDWRLRVEQFCSIEIEMRSVTERGVDIRRADKRRLSRFN